MVIDGSLEMSCTGRPRLVCSHLNGTPIAGGLGCSAKGHGGSAAIGWGILSRSGRRGIPSTDYSVERSRSCEGLARGQWPQPWLQHGVPGERALDGACMWLQGFSNDRTTLGLEPSTDREDELVAKGQLTSNGALRRAGWSSRLPQNRAIEELRKMSGGNVSPEPRTGHLWTTTEPQWLGQQVRVA